MSRPLYIHLSRMPRVFIDGEGIGTELSRKSQWFGDAFIPKGVEIPTRPNPLYHKPYTNSWDGRTVTSPERIPLPLICQIDCREIPPEATELPHDGELYIFAMLDYYGGGENRPIPMYASDEYLGVVYVPEEKFVDATYKIDPARTFSPERITLSFERPTGDEPQHLLLGEPEHRKGDEWDSPFQGWKVLFQMDSCSSLYYRFNFKDGGVFNILIDPEDLKRRDFSKVVGVILPA